MTDDLQTTQASPRKIAKIIRNAPSKSAFFVQGRTELLITGRNAYLPLAGNVKVTRKAMLVYINELQESSERQENHRGVELTIKLDVYGNCYFV